MSQHTQRAAPRAVIEPIMRRQWRRREETKECEVCATRRARRFTLRRQASVFRECFSLIHSAFLGVSLADGWFIGNVAGRSVLFTRNHGESALLINSPAKKCLCDSTKIKLNVGELKRLKIFSWRCLIYDFSSITTDISRFKSSRPIKGNRNWPK